MAKADFITGLVILVLGVYMMVEGMRMPGAGGFIEAGGEPGRVPMMLGAILALLAMILVGRAVARGGHRLFAVIGSSAGGFSGWVRSGIAAAICTLYALVLLGGAFLDLKMPYREATALFVFLFIVGFEWAEAREMGRHRWAWLQERLPGVAAVLSTRLGFVSAAWAPYLWLIVVALVQALLVAYAVAYLFEQQLYVKLP